MIRIEKYTGEKTYMYPNGSLATPDTIKTDFSAVQYFTHIVETDEEGQVLFAIQNLAALRGLHNINKKLTEDEAIAELEIVINEARKPVEPEPSAEERIAAALEFNNLLQM